MTRPACHLSAAIAQALGQHQSWLAVGPRALALGFDDLDPSLPALPRGGTAGAGLSDDQIRAYAALYYYGELESTGLMEVAELIVQERDMMGIRDAGLYQALDDMHRQMGRGWYDTARRQSIFRTMLGLGQQGGVQDAVLGLCHAISQFENALRYGGRIDHGLAARLDMAAQVLMSVIVNRAAMGLEQAARLLNGQTRTVINVMQNPALHRRTGARDMWGFLQSVATPMQGQLPDLGRAVRRAQSGANLIAALVGSRAAGGLVGVFQANPDLMRAAADWQMNAPSQSPAPAAPPAGGYYPPPQSGGWA
ncbi:hypothetical protein [Yoonia sp.]|uniref:hypothetical protein n=1 Tax=Yoonia sp. TaxID=2212373 RepID=UPI00358F8B41